MYKVMPRFRNIKKYLY